MKKVRIASAGVWHAHAKDFANRIESIPIPDAELVAVYDEDPVKAQEWATEKNVRCFTDYDALINDPDIDGIMVTCATAKHADLICRAAEAGKNVYVEKALATTREDARRVRETVHAAEKKYGIHFVMSDPVQGGSTLVAKKFIDEGKFGQVLVIRSKNGHDNAFRDPVLMKPFQTPEESGGGAMLDMGHHSVHVIHFLLGKPETVTGVFNSVNDYAKETGVEDFACLTYQYADGTIAEAQGAIITGRYANGLEIIGTKGYMNSNPATGTLCAFDGEEPFTISPSELPPKWKSPQMYWVECIRDNKPCEMYGVDEACELTEMVVAAYESKGMAVKI